MKDAMQLMHGMSCSFPKLIQFPQQQFMGQKCFIYHLLDIIIHLITIPNFLCSIIVIQIINISEGEHL